jgi:hypothetical protein
MLSWGWLIIGHPISNASVTKVWNVEPRRIRLISE